MRSTPHPGSVGLPENPYPGSDGHTMWKASSARPPWAVGSVSGSTTRWSSATEPGQPWVITSGRASSWGERTCRKWMSSGSHPSTEIGVVNWGNRLSRASRSRQS